MKPSQTEAAVCDRRLSFFPEDPALIERRYNSLMQNAG
jgi:hypothetical protein